MQSGSEPNDGFALGDDGCLMCGGVIEKKFELLQIGNGDLGVGLVHEVVASGARVASADWIRHRRAR
jgi:hypothetical protein